jgi:integrase
MLPRFYFTRRNNGTYYIGKNIDGKIQWRSTGKKLKSEARQVFEHADELFKKKLAEKTFQEFTVLFLDYAKATLSKSSLEIYNRAFRHFKEYFQSVALDELSSRHFDMYKAYRIKETTAVTVNQELRTLRAALFVALRWELIKINPFSKQKFLPEPEKFPAYFTYDDFYKLLSVMPNGIVKEVTTLAVLTGMRLGELLNMTWNDIDFIRRTIVIQSTPTFRTKQGKRRIIPLNDTAHAFLLVKKEVSNDKFVFAVDGVVQRTDSVSQTFRFYIKKAELKEKGLHFHSLRHTHATWLVMKGVSIYEIQKLLGHSNIRITEVYSHLQTELLHPTVNKIQLSLN